MSQSDSSLQDGALPEGKAMFYDDFKEKFAPKIKLPGKHFDDILELMKVLHPPNKELDESNVGLLLPLAREYQMEHLLFRCERFLLTRPPSVQGLLLAEEFDLDCLKRQCMRYIKNNKLQDLKAEAEFEILKSQTKVQILLEKSMKYEALVYEVKEIVTGHRPEQVRFRSGGTLCTFTCSDKEKSSGRLPHNAGTDMCCKRCALYMVSRIGKQIENLP
ncbi:hypothetical protein CAPTEDRAFT_208069 [Capitella teleta]|uniref:BTB domain-containing protein n=1 Tax=Capitella teleta TaxID=283909 RepID=R7UX42_CAPTE|nr:hypothetical protein CAPTEDRAFT_208069 [Capitella teleta]|eukprot:ELU08482.1 hypothetical protein CAPTEDRAFT_208069 [Capitella teleta]